MANAVEAPKGKGGISILTALILTVAGAGAGGFFGLQVPKLLGLEGEGARHAFAMPDPAKAIYVHTLPAITTNLANPANTWIRLESSVLVRGELGLEGKVVLDKIPQDIVSYLRTVQLAQMEGPSGFQHLREDLNDRVRVRSEGKVLELIIQALVVE